MDASTKLLNCALKNKGNKSFYHHNKNCYLPIIK